MVVFGGKANALNTCNCHVVPLSPCVQRDSKYQVVTLFSVESWGPPVLRCEISRKFSSASKIPSSVVCESDRVLATQDNVMLRSAAICPTCKTRFFREVVPTRIDRVFKSINSKSYRAVLKWEFRVCQLLWANILACASVWHFGDIMKSWQPITRSFSFCLSSTSTF